MYNRFCKEMNVFDQMVYKYAMYTLDYFEMALRNSLQTHYKL